MKRCAALLCTLLFLSVPVARADSPGFVLTQDDVRTAEGEFYWMRRYEMQDTGSDRIVTGISIPGKEGSVRFYNRRSRSWETLPLEGELPFSLLYIQTDEYFLLLCPPILYRQREFNCLEQVEVGSVSAVREEGKYSLWMSFNRVPGAEAHVWGLQSRHELIPWNENNEEIWKGYSNLESQRWTSHGYYYQVRDVYKPSGLNIFWRNPAGYLPASFVNTGGSPAARALGRIMMNHMLTWQHRDGYWLSDPQSPWLWQDYGIGHGFYDTRFNAEMTYACLSAYQRYGEAQFAKAAVSQLEWFIYYAQRFHFEVRRGAATGWLVQDYCWPGKDGETRPTLTVLNHQLQEIQTLYKAYAVLRDTRYLELAERLLDGIRITRDQWIREDDALHYAYLPDGSMGKEDYPAMTYNDLFALQKMRESLGLGRDADLEALMVSKRRHMEANGITGFLR